MSQNYPYLSIKSISVSATALATTKIDTTEAGGRRFIPLYVVMEITAATLLTIGPTISIGTNAGVDNIMAITASGLTALNTILVKPALGNTSTISVAAGTDINIKVTTGATATSAILKIDLLGYYQ